MRQSDLDNWFEYHSPNPGQVQTYAALRSKAKELAELFNDAVPDCADKTAAIRELRNTVMAMNLAVACYAPPPTYQSETVTQVATKD
jgi:hypothetical protein